MRADVSLELALAKRYSMFRSQTSQRNHLIRTGFATVLSVCAFLLVKIEILRGPLFGDDFLFVNDLRNPNDVHNPIGLLFWTGSEKWRPFATFPMGLFARHFGFEHRPYQIINIVLLLVLIAIVAELASKMTNSWLATVSTALLVGVSQFSWYGQVSLYGIMEIGALIFTFLGLRVLQGAWQRIEAPSVATLTSAAACLTTASLMHERYTVCLFGIWVLVLTRWRESPQIFRRTVAFLLIPLAQIVVRVYVLNLAPFQGGGESSTVGGSVVELVKRLLYAVLGLFGGNSGAGRYYAPGRFSTLVNQGNYGPWTFVTIIPIVATLGLMISVRRSGPRVIEALWNAASCLLLAVLLLLPAATVPERTEGRWLYGPQILLVCGLMTFTFRLISQEPHRKRTNAILAAITPLSLAGIAVSYRSQADTYTSLQRQTTAAIVALERAAPAKAPWNLCIEQAELSLPVQWQFAYGSALFQLANPPRGTFFVKGMDACGQIGTEMTLIRLKLTDIRIDNPIHVMSRVFETTSDKS